MSACASLIHAPDRGSAWYYDQGCRCAECRTAKMAKARRARARARAENRPSYQRALAHSRALKERYRGRCEHCGRKTTGCNGPGSAPTVCAICVPSVYGPRFAAEKRGVGSTVSLALAYMREPRTLSEIHRHLGITPNHAGTMLNRLVRYGLVRRIRRGVYEALPSAVRGGA